MPLLFMDAGCESESRDSLSAEECSSNTSGLEREGEEQQMGPKVTKRREKNRDAARKSRKKQTERADELHQELQRLEQSNSALQKEIASLKKDQQFYETVLERHKPHCHLRSSASSSAPCPSVSSSPQRQASSSPPQTSKSISPSRAESASPSTGPQSLNCTKETDFSPSASALTTTAAASSAASSANLSSSSSSSSPSTFPYSVAFSSQIAPHSLFSQLPLNTSRSTHVTPSCARLVSNPAPCTAAQLQPDTIPQNKTLAASQRSYFPGNAFSPASPHPQASASPLEAENTSATEQCHHRNLLQLYPFQLSGNPNDSRLPCALLPSPLPNPAPQTHSTSTHVLPFSLRQSCDQQVSTNSASMLSMLTVPSPLNANQTTSSSVMDESLTQPFPSLPPPAPQLDPFKDLSLSELLEGNDWILSGISDQ